MTCDWCGGRHQSQDCQNNNTFAKLEQVDYVGNALRNQQPSIHNLENQVGQIAKLLSERPQGILPSNTETNPREHLKVITLRSRKKLRTERKQAEKQSDAVKEVAEEEKGVEAKVKEKVEVTSKPTPFAKEYKLRMPKYAKFLKELLSNKRKLAEVLMVQLWEKSSTIIQRRLPKKLKDPWSFTIPCFIGNLNIDNALADLGASISVMAYNLSIIEDVLAKVQESTFSVDFVIMDMDEDVDVSLILGKPFLATVRAIIDVNDGKLILRARDEQLTFQTPDGMKHPLALNDMNSSDDMIEQETVNLISSIVAKDPLELCIVQKQEKLGTSEVVEQLAYLEAGKSIKKQTFKAIEMLNKERMRPPIKYLPTLKLKQFPSHLEYVFLVEMIKLLDAG
ncbi:uncharacterized protein LOC125369276 [Ricinus communis]|uniref:uncharacterized protein LOC125369276 n=1 Tax=Ricinus communis TaxID=3988 RepID=UPI00201AFAB8|nr:uncharacterized protein LOC125369276 [Ricinus communis]